MLSLSLFYNKKSTFLGPSEQISGEVTPLIIIKNILWECRRAHTTTHTCTYIHTYMERNRREIRINSIILDASAIIIVYDTCQPFYLQNDCEIRYRILTP